MSLSGKVGSGGLAASGPRLGRATVQLSGEPRISRPALHCIFVSGVSEAEQGEGVCRKKIHPRAGLGR